MNIYFNCSAALKPCLLQTILFCKSMRYWIFLYYHRFGISTLYLVYVGHCSSIENCCILLSCPISKGIFPPPPGVLIGFFLFFFLYYYLLHYLLVILFIAWHSCPTWAWVYSSRGRPCTSTHLYIIILCIYRSHAVRSSPLRPYDMYIKVYVHNMQLYYTYIRVYIPDILTCIPV